MTLQLALMIWIFGGVAYAYACRKIMLDQVHKRYGVRPEFLPPQAYALGLFCMGVGWPVTLPFALFMMGRSGALKLWFYGSIKSGDVIMVCGCEVCCRRRPPVMIGRYGEAFNLQGTDTLVQVETKRYLEIRGKIIAAQKTMNLHTWRDETNVMFQFQHQIMDPAETPTIVVPLHAVLDRVKRPISSEAA